MGIQSKRPKTKTSQVICQHVPFLVSQNVPSIFSLYLIKLEIANIFCEHTGQNVPKSNCPKSKRPKIKMSQVKMSQSQNVPSQNVPDCQNVPESKRPKSQVKMSQVKAPQSQNVPSQKSHLVCLHVNNVTHTVMKFLVYTSNMLYYSDNLHSTSL